MPSTRARSTHPRPSRLHATSHRLLLPGSPVRSHPHPALATPPPSAHPPAVACTLLRRSGDAGGAHAAALEAADRLTREVVAATSHLPPSAASLGHALRESAVLAHAGTAAACRRPPGTGRDAFASTDHCLRRLATWLDLAQRFGDLPTPAVLALLESLSRCRVELILLAETPPRTAPADPAIALPNPET